MKRRQNIGNWLDLADDDGSLHIDLDECLEKLGFEELYGSVGERKLGRRKANVSTVLNLLVLVRNKGFSHPLYD